MGDLLISRLLHSNDIKAMDVTWASTKTSQEGFLPMSQLVKEILQQNKASKDRLEIYQPQGLLFMTPRNFRSIYVGTPEQVRSTAAQLGSAINTGKLASSYS